MKRLLKNVEIAEFVKKGLEEKFKKEFDLTKILDGIDGDLAYDKDYNKDENGNISDLLTEDQINEIKKNFLDGFMAEYEYMVEE